MVFTSCVDGNVRVWDARTGLCSITLTGHTDMVLDMRLVDLRQRQQQQDAAGDAATALVPGGVESPVLIVTASDDHTTKVFRWPQEENAQHENTVPQPSG